MLGFDPMVECNRKALIFGKPMLPLLVGEQCDLLLSSVFSQALRLVQLITSLPIPRP